MTIVAPSYRRAHFMLSGAPHRVTRAFIGDVEIKVGDRITYSDHSGHYIVRAIATSNRKRPSRGYARHVRRRKQRERKP